MNTDQLKAIRAIDAEQIAEIKARDERDSHIFERWQPISDSNERFEAATKDRHTLLAALEASDREHNLALNAQDKILTDKYNAAVAQNQILRQWGSIDMFSRCGAGQY